MVTSITLLGSDFYTDYDQARPFVRLLYLHVQLVDDV